MMLSTLCFTDNTSKTRFLYALQTCICMVICIDLHMHTYVVLYLRKPENVRWLAPCPQPSFSFSGVTHMSVLLSSLQFPVERQLLLLHHTYVYLSLYLCCHLLLHEMDEMVVYWWTVTWWGLKANLVHLKI